MDNRSGWVPAHTRNAGAAVASVVLSLCALLAAVAVAAVALSPSLAFSSEALSFFSESQGESAEGEDGTVHEADAAAGVFVMVHETAYTPDGTEILVWGAELDDRGNAASMVLSQGLSGTNYEILSNMEFDELGGIVSSVTHVSSIGGDDAHSTSTRDIVIVDERSGRVDSYVRGSATVLLSYGQSGKVELIASLYSLDSPSGTLVRYDESGLPVWVGDVDGYNANEELNVVPRAEIEWTRDGAGAPVEVCVRNTGTGGERRDRVEVDEYGNVIAIVRADGTVALEFSYEYVENPSPLVAAMPPEYLADVVLLAGVPD